MSDLAADAPPVATAAAMAKGRPGLAPPSPLRPPWAWNRADMGFKPPSSASWGHLRGRWRSAWAPGSLSGDPDLGERPLCGGPLRRPLGYERSYEWSRVVRGSPFLGVAPFSCLTFPTLCRDFGMPPCCRKGSASSRGGHKWPYFFRYGHLCLPLDPRSQRRNRPSEPPLCWPSELAI